ncbi:MAG: hypothetical protein WC520_02055 [Candidatus Paceibacterota bacterium]
MSEKPEMSISVKVGSHQKTDGLNELLSATEMTHNECNGGKVELKWKNDSHLVFTCMKCGESKLTKIFPRGGTENKISLASFLTGDLVPENGRFAINTCYECSPYDIKYYGQIDLIRPGVASEYQKKIDSKKYESLKEERRVNYFVTVISIAFFAGIVIAIVVFLWAIINLITSFF